MPAPAPRSPAKKRVMAPLKSLEKDYPIIDSDFQQFFASHGIFSVEDFLLRDLDILVVLAEQCYNSNRLKQGITQILSIIDGQHQPWLNGLELLEGSQKSKQVLATGCDRIDAFLQGGLQEGFLTELVGPSSSGKTQVCLLAASSVAKYYSGRIMFIDTGNSFSVKRVAHFVNQSSTGGNAKRVLDKILYHPVFDIFTLFDVLHEVLSSLKHQTGPRLRMLIVDSISSLITPVLGRSGSQGDQSYGGWRRRFN